MKGGLENAPTWDEGFDVGYDKGYGQAAAEATVIIAARRAVINELCDACVALAEMDSLVMAAYYGPDGNATARRFTSETGVESDVDADGSTDDAWHKVRFDRVRAAIAKARGEQVEQQKGSKP